MSSNKPNYLGCRIPVTSNINCTLLKEWLSDYHDKGVVNFIRFGWPIDSSTCEPHGKSVKNHQGALQFQEELNKHIRKELEAGYVIGPLQPDSLKKPIIISPLNTRPKKDSESRRIILDLSYPGEGSVNSGIDKDKYLGVDMQLVYPSIDNLIALVNKFKGNCLLFK